MTNYPKMNEFSIGQKNPAIFSGHRYRDLYIYHLEGHLAPGTNLSSNDFIGNWQEEEFSFLFFSAPSEKLVEQLLSVQPQLTLLDNFHMTYDDWQGGKLVPIRVGRFLIAPPWNKIWNHAAADKEIIPLTIDPGVVFGNGSHATTYDCLKALELLFENAAPQTALDLGTGTGVLALAAARLGCKQTLAVDTNFLATTNALTNIRSNHMQDRIVVVQGRAEDVIYFQTDLVIANIHYEVIKKLISSQGFFNKKWFILSGLLRNQAKDVAASLSQRSVRIIKKWDYDGVWHTFFGKIS